MSLPRIVIDTNVLVSALRSRRGASSRLVSLVGTDAFEVHLSVPLTLEYEAVLMRQRRALGLSRQDVTDVVDALCALSVPHAVYFLGGPTSAMRATSTF